MMAIQPELLRLIEVLREARALLSLPSNDFVWSSWADAEAATADIDAHITAIEQGRLPERGDVSILFAPTGSMQKVSLSSGWSMEFLAVAERFDAAAEIAWV